MDESVHADTKILDNRGAHSTLAAYLREKLAGARQVRIVSAYFSIFGFETLAAELEAGTLEEVCFLLGEPSNSAPLTGDKPPHLFQLTETGIAIQNSLLQQKPLAKRCAEWIKRAHVHIRTMAKANFLHAKMYHITRGGGGTATVGSSNFTQRGLGATAGTNIELNLALATDDQKTQRELASWFDEIWKDTKMVEDIKGRMLEALEHIYIDYSPEIIYYKTLYEIFAERIKEQAALFDGRMGDVKESVLWQKLYSFQQDGYHSIINCLKNYNGCILADSVGLGKTYTALAVIRHYQHTGNGVLVLCPKRLENNWNSYRASAQRASNPFPDIDYALLFHTDLGRERGKRGSIDLANFNWEHYSLIVIDESHNFRNDSKSTRNEDGSIKHLSRYEKLFRDVIRKGTKTKVLLISATPVNTSLLDLRNQINLITAGQEDAFSETLGIHSFSQTIKKAQRAFEHWAKQKERQKSGLIDALDGECRNLLYNIVVARTRRQIKHIYGAEHGDSNTPLVFPERAQPENLTPPIDTEEKLSFNTLAETLSGLRLSIYKPTAYAASDTLRAQLEQEKSKYNFNQSDREEYLVGMMTTNYIKRLESSVEAFRKTIRRALEKIDERLEQLARYLTTQENHELHDEQELADDEQLQEDEDVRISPEGGTSIHLSDLDCARWRKDIARDRAHLHSVLWQVEPIDEARDGKLQRLKELVEERAITQKRKLLIFTSFTDTAQYLYDHLSPFVKEEHGIQSALVSGTRCMATRHSTNDQHEILSRFAPRAHNNRQLKDGEEIDILISTDCISEGQNLQDCDTVINYDIHWNPVRIIQRRGRIDRIGSPHKRIHSIRFWPTQDIDDYLKLQNRFTARMDLVEATTGDFKQYEGEEIEQAIQQELDLRDEQIKKMQDSALDLEDDEGTIVWGDIALNVYQSQLQRFLENNKKRLEQIPHGAYAVVENSKGTPTLPNTPPRVIFLFRRINSNTKLKNNPFDPYYLVCLTEEGILYEYTVPEKSLQLFDALTQGMISADTVLCQQFDSEIASDSGKKLYNRLALSAQRHVRKTFQKQNIQQLHNPRALLATEDETPSEENLELITWLVIKGKK